jgi:pimeloyl-ACP methyl ester carboxylesterase
VTTDLSILPSGRHCRITRTGMSGGASAASVAAADAAAAGGVPAVICLHGRNQSDAFAFDDVMLPDFAQVAGLDIVVAALDGGPTSYWHRRASGADPLADLFDELIPLVDARSGGGPRVVMGWSMGGYGALLAAERRPDLFSAVVAASPAVWRRAADASEGAFDGAADFAAHDVLASLDRLPKRVLIDCGEDDPFADVSRELLRRIPGAQGRVRPGFHDSQFWRTLVPEQLAFITAST